MTELGERDGRTTVVDLRHKSIESVEALWDALASPCGLPNWFGRNLNAWWDTIEAGAISDIVDAHEFLKIVVSPTGIFAPQDPRGEAFIQVTNKSRYASAEVGP